MRLDGEADRQLVFTAARRFCPAVLTSPRAATTPDTVLTPGCVTRSLTDVLSLESDELSELVWAWYWPCARRGIVRTVSVGCGKNAPMQSRCDAVIAADRDADWEAPD